jgi:hypothetical protein
MVDRLLDLTRQAEANHFWYHGFRSYLLPVFRAGGGGAVARARCSTSAAAPATTWRCWPARVGGGAGPQRARLTLAREIGRPLVRARHGAPAVRRRHLRPGHSFDMMQCIPTDREAVREMARVAKPGGVVVISMAALEILHGDHSEVWQEYRRYTRASARALRGAGRAARRARGVHVRGAVSAAAGVAWRAAADAPVSRRSATTPTSRLPRRR